MLKDIAKKSLNLKVLNNMEITYSITEKDFWEFHFIIWQMIF